MEVADLYKLNRDQLEVLARARDSQDWKGVNVVAQKARTYCHESVVGWNKPVGEAVNAIVRAVRHGGPWDTLKLSAVMAAAEDAAVAEQAREVLTEQEFNLLTTPLYSVLATVTEDQTGGHVPPGPMAVAPAKESTRKRAQKAKPQEGVNPNALEDLAAQIAAAAEPLPTAITHDAIQEIDLDDLFGGGSVTDDLLGVAQMVAENPGSGQPAAPATSDDLDLFGDVA